MTFFHDGSWLPEELKRFASGQIVDRTGKRYAVCPVCRKVVCLNKKLFGNLHFCEPQTK